LNLKAIGEEWCKNYPVHPLEVKYCNLSMTRAKCYGLVHTDVDLYKFTSTQDTDVIVWDIVNESGLYRLKGHKGQITQAMFLKEKNVIVSRCVDGTAILFCSDFCIGNKFTLCSKFNQNEMSLFVNNVNSHLFKKIKCVTTKS
jgi:WD40 repeat protein